MSYYPKDMVWFNFFKSRIRTAFDESGLTLEMFSDKMELSIDDANHLLAKSNNHIPNEAIIKKLCQVFGFSISFLFTNSD
jgi:transcriptional regulator with XRE-family HTH domain